MTSERLAAYQAFVQNSASRDAADGYLFDTPRCRFTLEPSDELVAAPGARVVGTLIELPNGARLPMVGLEPPALRAAFGALPCSYSRLTLELGGDAPSFVEQAFSRVVFAPAAVLALEQAVAGAELVRFPGSPYEIVRSYWRNSAAVRRCIEASGLPQDRAELRALLLELHELMLLGENPDGRTSFYLPASLLGRKRPTPGRFYEAPSGVELRAGQTILTSGARVSAPLLGGVHYWQLLAESVGDLGALGAERELTEAGVSLGRLVHGRAEDEPQARPWFLPPRPLLDAHFELLLDALARAQRAETAHDPAALVAALADFHWRFVRVHPLPSANQSLSMSFVNAALRRTFGAGIPHLLLDQLALRFDAAAYRTLLARAVQAWCVPFPTPSQRLIQLGRMAQTLNELATSLGAAGSLLEARALLPRMSYAAELGLLSDAPQAR
jgi:hypothetical protein